jgi:hypothetical protein
VFCPVALRGRGGLALVGDHHPDQACATLHIYQHPGRATRRLVLRDTRNDRGTQFEDDGTLRVTGHHTGPGVSEFFGAAITSYDWAYVIAPDRTAALFTLLGGHTSDDVLNLLATYHHQHGGQINDLLHPRGPVLAARCRGAR